jgi:MFS family permease
MSMASNRRILFASLVGTSIEFFDFYAYATAAVIVFPQLFFPASEPSAALLQSFATFALAFVARPFGAVLFGHFGDRIGRKSTLVAALLTMGVSTVAIGMLPTYGEVGVLAPVLLGLCRFGQGLGLGGEWGGAVLLATENALPPERAWFGMFPQLGAPIGFLASTGVFLALTRMSDEHFLTWGWRLPFLASAALVGVGLYVRLRLAETRDFRIMTATKLPVRNPMRRVMTRHTRALFLGTLAATAPFVILYVITVFSLSWATSKLGYTRPQMLVAQMIGMVVLGLLIPVSARLAQRWSAKSVLMAAIVGLTIFGLIFGSLFRAGSFPMVLITTVSGLGLAGLSYGPLGTALAELFPTHVRYTGISLAFNLAGILGASATPYIATGLASGWGLPAVGYYLSAVVIVSAVALGTMGLGMPRKPISY